MRLSIFLQSPIHPDINKTIAPIAFFLFMLFVTSAITETVIPGSSFISGTWTKEGSPYIIQGKSMIPEDSVLTIEPGVEVKFKASENYGTGIVKGDFHIPTLNVGFIVVDGKLIAIGTEEDSITFTRNDTKGHWGIIVFTEKSDSLSFVKYCTISYSFCITVAMGDTIPDSLKSILGGGALSFNNAKATIDSCTIAYTKTQGINCRGNSRSTIVHNLFTSSSISCYNSSDPLISDNEFYESNISSYKSSPVIKNNAFSGSYSGIYISDSSYQTISDNTFTGNGYGIQVSSTGKGLITIRNNEFTNNSIGVEASGNTIIEKNIFQRNREAIHCFNGVTVQKNTITNNKRGILCQGNSYIVNNIISNNSEYGIYTYLIDAHIVGNLITNNLQNGISCSHSDPYITNNTIANNTGFGIECIGDVMHPEDISNPTIINTVIWGNSADMGFIATGHKPTISYSLVQGVSLPPNVIVQEGVLFNKNPLFKDEQGGNYQLQDKSPCINAGKPDTAGLFLPEYDIADSVRICGIIDIGAYESHIAVNIKNHKSNQKILHLNIINSSILFNLPTSANVKLQIYNMKGKSISTLVDSYKHAGSYKVNWDSKKFGAGIYFLKLSVNGSAVSKKFTIIK